MVEVKNILEQKAKRWRLKGNKLTAFEHSTNQRWLEFWV